MEKRKKPDIKCSDINFSKNIKVCIKKSSTFKEQKENSLISSKDITKNKRTKKKKKYFSSCEQNGDSALCGKAFNMNTSVKLKKKPKTSLCGGEQIDYISNINTKNAVPHEMNHTYKRQSGIQKELIHLFSNDSDVGSTDINEMRKLKGRYSSVNIPKKAITTNKGVATTESFKRKKNSLQKLNSGKVSEENFEKKKKKKLKRENNKPVIDFKEKCNELVSSESNFDVTLKQYIMHEKDEEESKDKGKLNERTLSKKKIKKLEKIEERKSKSMPARHPETEKRTIFVGNVSINTKRRSLQKFFAKYGKVEAVRFRGIATATEKGTRKEAIVKKKFHPTRDSMIAYVRFVDIDSKAKALEANGHLFQGLHLRVDEAVPSWHRNKYTIFVGNLPWGVNDEDLWKLFKGCGVVKNVRIVRSATTGAGKGIGYVSFDNKNAVESALQMDDKILQGRPIRVKKSIKKEKEQKVSKSFKKKKSAVSSLLSSKKIANKTSLHFLKQDKPRRVIRNRRGLQKKDENISKQKLKSKNEFQASRSNPFSGFKIVESDSIASNNNNDRKKKRPKISKGERKKLAIAKLLSTDNVKR